VIMVLDVEGVEVDLTAGAITSPRCAGSLRPWSSASVRPIRQLDGSIRLVRPRRARCASCGSTQVLLPADCLPRCGDATEVVGAALVAKAAGRGYRSIAAELHRAPATVRRWLRRVRGPHVEWLRRRGVEHAYRLDPELLGDLPVEHSELGDALSALGAAVHAWHRRLDRHARGWTLIGMFTAGRLLLPQPAS
jgi:hypothetical protein